MNRNQLMSYKVMFLLFFVFLNFFFSIFVYSKNKKKLVNITYAIFIFFISIWTLFLAVYHYDTSLERSVLWANLTYLFGNIIAVSFFLFSKVFPNKKLLSNKVFLISSLTIVVLIFIYFAINGMVISVYYNNGIKTYVYGKYHYVFEFHFIWFFASAFINLTKDFFRLEGDFKNQAKYLFTATLSAVIFNGYTNVILPGLYKDCSLLWLGPAITFIMVSTISFAIVRYRLMDISLVIKRTLVFLCIFLMIIFIVGIFTSATQGYLSQYLDVGDNISLTISILIAMLLYGPTRNLLVNVTDRFLFQKKYDYQKLLQRISQGISKIQSLDKLSQLIVTYLTFQTRINNSAIYSKNNNGDFPLNASRGYGVSDALASLSSESSIVNYFNLNKTSLKYEDWLNDDSMKNEMELLRANLVLPCFRARGGEEVQLTHILVLGKKKSDEEYSKEDINIFSSLAHSVATAMENAALFDEEVQRTRQLEKINNLLEDSNQETSKNQAKLLVAEKTATMVNMARAMGHEINNPLSISKARVNGMLDEDIKDLELLYKNHLAKNLDKNTTKQLNAVFSSVEDKCQRMNKAVSRIEIAVKILTSLLKSSKGELEPLNLRDVWDEAKRTSQFSTFDETLSNCQFEEKIPEDFTIRGDKGQVIQVLTILIKNSFEAMLHSDKREIRLRVERDLNDKNMAKITYSDSGTGIDPKIRHKIWAQGFSTKEGLSREGDDPAGQGLYICKHIVESIHRGQITVEGDYESGAIFILNLPLDKVVN